MKPIIILSALFILLGITYSSHVDQTASFSDRYEGYGMVVSPVCEPICSDEKNNISGDYIVDTVKRKAPELESSDDLNTQLSGKSPVIRFSIL
jgi:hypothetical protein